MDALAAVLAAVVPPPRPRPRPVPPPRLPRPPRLPGPPREPRPRAGLSAAAAAGDVMERLQRLRTYSKFNKPDWLKKA